MSSATSATNRITPRQARSRLLRMHYESGVGHIGGNLSALDAMLHLHTQVIGPDDLFVLSKGHSAGALYISLWAIGLIDDDALKTFHKDDTLLAGHPPAHAHDRIPFATGSLGHGLGLASGAALAKRLRCEDGTVYALLSDGECQEGSIWEAFIFARHHALANLVVLIDANRLQGFGSTADVASMDGLATRLDGFGLQVVEIDGHDEAALAAALATAHDGPLVILMHTVKGRGVSFMENRMEWHYLPLSAAQHDEAQAALAEAADA